MFFAHFFRKLISFIIGKCAYSTEAAAYSHSEPSPWFALLQERKNLL